MANGSFKTGWGQYTKDYELIVEWSSTANITTNTSTVKAVIKFYCPYACDIGKRYNNIVTINGVQYEYDSPAISTNGGETFILATINSGTIAHNADGSKNITISAQFRFNASLSGVSYGVQTASKTVALDSIPRAAEITAAPNFTDEDNPTITYSNPAGNVVTTLQACISLTGAAADIVYRDIPKTGTSYTFTLTDAERNVLRNATTTANSRTVYFYIMSIIGGVTYRKRLEKTLSIVNAAPTLSPTVKDVGSVSITLTGDANNKVIKGYNSMSVSAGATAQKGATIKSYKISCGGKSISTASGTLGNVESGTFTFAVTDSRGNTVTKTLNKTLINYVKPTCNLSVSAPTADGALTLTISGNYFNGTFGAVTNALTVQYRTKENSGSYGSWKTATATISGNTYRATVNLTGLNYRSSYTIEARTGDKIYNGSTEAYILSPTKVVKTMPVFDWSADDFNFNVPVNFSAGATGMGEYGEWIPTLDWNALTAYTERGGWYQKSGDIVTIGFYIKAICNSGYQTTSISIGGLPFVPAMSAAGGGMCSGAYVSSGFTFQCWVAGTGGTITARVQQVNHTTATNLSTSASGCFYRNGGGEITLSGTITYKGVS